MQAETVRREETTRRRRAPGPNGASSASQDGIDYYARNQAAWERWARTYANNARSAWEEPELRWGLWGAGESELCLLEGLEPDSDIVELGCGAAAIPAALTRLGFRPVGVDFSRILLEKGAELQREFEIWFPLLRANAE